ncbi:MAG: 1-acyl-sn-glycerol-3-phosphate acyltransferase, partial [Proteobacteria bacterium]|nr:1-acyl-sn-glycerol-3-phosphate acyltransferase [Pseudomonadota bacterium]
MVNDYLQLWATGIMKAVRVDCKVFNAYQVEFKEHEPYILMVNHSSLYDIPITFVALPNITMRMLAKKELFQIPIFGQGLKVAEFVFIDRKNREQAMKDLAQAKEKLESGIRLWIAPEGTRSRNGQLGPFKKGGFVTAIQTKAKIIPIIIKGAANILPPKTWRFHINQTVEVHIGQPIDA